MSAVIAIYAVLISVAFVAVNAMRGPDEVTNFWFTRGYLSVVACIGLFASSLCLVVVMRSFPQ